MAVLLQDGNAEAVEGTDIARVVIPGQPMDALAHFGCGFVGERHTQDVAGQDARFIDQIREPVRERARLARARARDHADEALCCRDRFPLCVIQLFQYILHLALRAVFLSNSLRLLYHSTIHFANICSFSTVQLHRGMGVLHYVTLLDPGCFCAGDTVHTRPARPVLCPPLQTPF